MKKAILTPGKSNRRTIADLNNVDIVLLSTFLLGGHLKIVDTEDVAVRAHQISPGRFSWRKYQDQIDIERVRVRLSQAAHEGKLSGVHSKGWRLTASGAKYVLDKLLGVAKTDNVKISVGKADRSWIASERKRLMGTQAYKKSVANDSNNITNIDISEFFRVDEYMSSEIRKTKLDRIVSAFRNDTALGKLVVDLAHRIGDE